MSNEIDYATWFINFDNSIQKAMDSLSLYGKTNFEMEYYKVNKCPEIKNVIFNDRATIVFWTDDTKTVVVCNEDEVFDKWYGIAMCHMKKLYGNDYKYCRICENWENLNEERQILDDSIKFLLKKKPNVVYEFTKWAAHKSMPKNQFKTYLAEVQKNIKNTTNGKFIKQCLSKLVQLEDRYDISQENGETEKKEN